MVYYYLIKGRNIRFEPRKQNYNITQRTNEMQWRETQNIGIEMGFNCKDHRELYIRRNKIKETSMDNKVKK